LLLTLQEASPPRLPVYHHPRLSEQQYAAPALRVLKSRTSKTSVPAESPLSVRTDTSEEIIRHPNELYTHRSGCRDATDDPTKITPRPRVGGWCGRAHRVRRSRLPRKLVRKSAPCYVMRRVRPNGQLRRSLPRATMAIVREWHLLLEFTSRVTTLAPRLVRVRYPPHRQ
jgi:hypothetical protein